LFDTDLNVTIATAGSGTGDGATVDIAQVAIIAGFITLFTFTHILAPNAIAASR